MKRKNPNTPPSDEEFNAMNRLLGQAMKRLGYIAGGLEFLVKKCKILEKELLEEIGNPSKNIEYKELATAIKEVSEMHQAHAQRLLNVARFGAPCEGVDLDGCDTYQNPRNN